MGRMSGELPWAGQTGSISEANRPGRASLQSSPSLKAAADSKSRCATTSPRSSPDSQTHPFTASQNLLLQPGPRNIRGCQPWVCSDGYGTDCQPLLSSTERRAEPSGPHHEPTPSEMTTESGRPYLLAWPPSADVCDGITAALPDRQQESYRP